MRVHKTAACIWALNMVCAQLAWILTGCGSDPSELSDATTSGQSSQSSSLTSGSVSDSTMDWQSTGSATSTPTETSSTSVSSDSGSTNTPTTGDESLTPTLTSEETTATTTATSSNDDSSGGLNPIKPTTAEEWIARSLWVSHAMQADARHPGFFVDTAVLVALGNAGQLADVEVRGKIATEIHLARETKRVLPPREWSMLVGYFDTLAKNLAKQDIPHTASILQRCFVDTLAPAMVDNRPWPVEWRSLASQAKETAFAEIWEWCQNTELTAFCSDLLYGLVGQPASARYADLCAGADPGGCKSLALAMPDATHVDAVLADTVYEAKMALTECVKHGNCPGNTTLNLDADLKRQRDIAATAEVASSMSLISPEKLEQLKKIAKTVGSVGKNAKKIKDSMDALKIDVDKKTITWSAVLDFWFSGFDEGHTLGGVVKNVVAIFTGIDGIVSAVSGVFKMFGDAGGHLEDQAVLAAIAELRDMIVELRTVMETRFNVIDAKLDRVLATMISGLTVIQLNQADTAKNLQEVSVALASIQSQIAGLSMAVQAFLSEISRAELTTSVTGLDSIISEPEFVKQVTTIFLYGQNVAPTTLHTGPTRPDYGDDLKFEFSGRLLSTVVNALSQAGRVVFGGDPLALTRVVSPSEIVYVLRLYSKMLERYPAFAKNHAEMISEQWKQLSLSILALQNLTVAAQNADLHRRSLAGIHTSYDTLQAAMDDYEAEFLRAHSPALIDLSKVIDLWLGAQQATTHIPAVFGTAVPHCDNPSASPLSMPANLIDTMKTGAANAAFLADALGLGKLSLCWRTSGTDLGQYTKTDRVKRGSGDWISRARFDVEVKMSLDSVPVRTQNKTLPEGATDDPKTFVCMFTADGGSGATAGFTTMPATLLTTKAWSGTYARGGSCASDPVSSISNVRDSFASAQTIFNWNASDTEAAINAELQRLRHEFFANLAAQLQGSGKIGKAAYSLDGHIALSRRLIELAFPSLAEADPRYAHLFESDAKIKTSADLIAMCNHLAKTSEAVERLILAENGKLAPLIEMIERRVEALKSGLLIDRLDDVETARIRADLAVRAARD